MQPDYIDPVIGLPLMLALWCIVYLLERKARHRG